MKNIIPRIILICVTVVGIYGQGISDVIIFDGALKIGGMWAEGGGLSEVSNDLSYNSHDVIKINPGTAAYASGGIALNVDQTTVPVDATTLRLAVYIPTGSTFGDFLIDTSTYGSTFAFDSSTGTWTVDGQPGSVSTSVMTRDTWHVVDLDLTSIPGTVPGTTALDFRVAMKRGGTGAADPNLFYMGEVSLIPEPSALFLVMMGFGGLLLLKRRV